MGVIGDISARPTNTQKSFQDCERRVPGSSSSTQTVSVDDARSEELNQRLDRLESLMVQQADKLAAIESKRYLQCKATNLLPTNLYLFIPPEQIQPESHHWVPKLSVRRLRSIPFSLFVFQTTHSICIFPFQNKSVAKSAESAPTLSSSTMCNAKGVLQRT